MSYNSDQPRDASGRWTSGGSGARLTKAAREKVAIGKAVDSRNRGAPRKQLPPATLFQKVVSGLQKKFGDAAPSEDRIREIMASSDAARPSVTAHADAAAIGTHPPTRHPTHGMTETSAEHWARLGGKPGGEWSDRPDFTDLFEGGTEKLRPARIKAQAALRTATRTGLIGGKKQVYGVIGPREPKTKP